MTSKEEQLSPRLANLRNELAAGSRDALDAFHQEMAASGTPLIEPLNDREVIFTFLWFAQSPIDNVALVSNLSGEYAAVEPLASLLGTNLWYKSYRLPSDTLESYQFAMGEEHLADPLNPHKHVFPGDAELGFTGWESSIVKGPGALPDRWSMLRPDVSRGRLERSYLKSSQLDQDVPIWVYTPPGYQPGGAPYDFLLFLDGWFYAYVIGVPTILDNLAGKGILPPMVAVMVGDMFDTNRGRNLACYPPFVNFLTSELLPWLRQAYTVGDDPAQNGVGGASLGGLMAGYIGLRHPDIFGNVFIQSAYLGWRPAGEEEDNWLLGQFAASRRLPLRFHLDAGLFETRITTSVDGRTTDILATARKMHDLLEAMGYPVHYVEFSGGHGPMNWPRTLGEGLVALYGASMGSY